MLGKSLSLVEEVNEREMLLPDGCSTVEPLYRTARQVRCDEQKGVTKPVRVLGLWRSEVLYQPSERSEKWGEERLSFYQALPST